MNIAKRVGWHTFKTFATTTIVLVAIAANSIAIAVGVRSFAESKQQNPINVLVTIPQ